MQNNMPTKEEMRRIYLFESLDDEQLDEVIKSAHQLSLETHERLFERGEHADRFYLLCSGQVKLFQVSAEGYEKIFEIIQPGQTFAEAIMFMEQHRYPVSVEAILASELFSFDMRTFRNILKDSNATCFRLMSNMSRRLHSSIREINSLALQNATYRLVNYLLDQIPDEAPERPAIHLVTQKSVIASRLSIQPETFSRILSRLIKNGIISVSRQDISVHNVKGLREFIVQ